MSSSSWIARTAGITGLGALLLAGCVPRDDSPADTGPDTGLTVDTGATWTPSGLPLWIYQNQIAADLLEFYHVDGVKAVRIPGYSWSGDPYAPTLIAEIDHEILFTVSNTVAESFDFAFEGVEVVNNPTVAEGTTLGVDTNLLVRTTLGPGVYGYRAASAGADVGVRGMLGIVAIRDPAEFPVEDIEEQGNLLLVDLPVEEIEADGCVLWPDTAAIDCTPDGEGDVPESWEPAPPGYNTVLVGQNLRLNTGRHGGPPNEFITSGVRSSRRMYFDEGSDVRLNLLSESAEAHTLTFGGLTWTDPVSGALHDSVVLEPGQGTHVLWQAVAPAGEYLVECADHEHHGLASLYLVIE